MKSNYKHFSPLHLFLTFSYCIMDRDIKGSTFLQFMLPVFFFHATSLYFIFITFPHPTTYLHKMHIPDMFSTMHIYQPGFAYFIIYSFINAFIYCSGVGYGATFSSDHGLCLVLCSGIIPDDTWDTICGNNTELMLATSNTRAIISLLSPQILLALFLKVIALIYLNLFR